MWMGKERVCVCGGGDDNTPRAKQKNTHTQNEVLLALPTGLIAAAPAAFWDTL